MRRWTLLILAVLTPALAGCVGPLDDGIVKPVVRVVDEKPTTHKVDLGKMAFQLGPTPNAQTEYAFEAPPNTTKILVEVVLTLRAATGARIEGTCSHAFSTSVFLPEPLGSQTEAVECAAKAGPGSAILRQDGGRMAGEIHVTATVLGKH